MYSSEFETSYITAYIHKMFISSCYGKESISSEAAGSGPHDGTGLSHSHVIGRSLTYQVTSVGDIKSKGN